MEAIKLLTEVLDRYQTAMAFHWESQNLFCWLSLDGFAKLHEYQFWDETKSASKLKKHIIEMYGVVVPDKGPENPGILEMIPDGKDRIDVSFDEKWNLNKDAWDKYRLWELKTRREYQRIASELLREGRVDDFGVMSGIVQDVSDEIVKIESIIMDMSGTNYDMPHISDMQVPLKAEHNKKLHALFKEQK